MMLLVLAGVFLGTILLVVGVFVGLNRRRLEESDVLRERLFGDTKGEAQAASIAIFKDAQRASSLSFLNKLLEGRNFTSVMQAELDRAGSTQTVGTFVLTVAVSAALAGFLGSRLLTPLFGAVLAALGALIPFLLIKRKQAARYKKFEEQLPEGIDMLVNAMKAGYSLQAAMKFIGDELPAPLGPEFSRFYDEQRLGVDVRAALLHLQERVDTLDLKMFVTALLIQRETGGNLAEIMTNLSSLMRERAAIRGQIDVLTAEPRMSAIVLTALPVVIFAIINVLNPEYVLPLYTTPAGRMLLVYAVISSVIGYIVLKRIGTIEV